MSVHGVLQVHSAPPALCPHIEWAVAGVLGVPVDLAWVGQPAAPGDVRGELNWHARPGMAGSITSALAGWNRLRFEVTEEASPGCDAVRYSYTPALGTFSAVTGANQHPGPGQARRGRVGRPTRGRVAGRRQRVLIEEPCHISQQI